VQIPLSVLHFSKQIDTLYIHMSKNQLNEMEIRVLRLVRNALVHDGRSPSVRDLAKTLGYRSPRSAFLLLNSLINKGLLRRKDDGGLQLRKDLDEAEDHARTIDVPLVGCVLCGAPLLAEENIETHIPVSRSLARAGSKYFLLRASGDSMDQAGINDGDLLLVRQQSVADDGDKVVALIDDNATVKEFRRGKGVVVLQPRSSNKDHKPILLTESFIVQGVVVAVIDNLH
jgi:repressor LexA